MQQGEEITVFYLRILDSRSRRLAKMNGLCALEPKESHASDVTLETILRMENFISQGGLEAILTISLQILRYVDQNSTNSTDQGMLACPGPFSTLLR